MSTFLRDTTIAVSVKTYHDKHHQIFRLMVTLPLSLILLVIRVSRQLLCGFILTVRFYNFKEVRCPTMFTSYADVGFNLVKTASSSNIFIFLHTDKHYHSIQFYRFQLRCLVQLRFYQFLHQSTFQTSYYPHN